jgi:hypothetical protein
MLIRRLKCSYCPRIHSELPDILSPYKHYTAEVIVDVVDEVVDISDPAIAEGPCVQTIDRWKKWIRKNITQIEGYLKAVNHQILGFSMQHVKSGSSLLKKIRDAQSDWLGIINRVIYNTGGFLQL